jgi:gliding motility-associated-like protein
VNDIPEINLSEYNNIEIEGSTVEISELNNYQNYQWISNAELECNVCASTSFVVEEDTELTLIVRDENGCQNQTELFIEFRQSCRLDELLIPDAITPNGNGRNDKFRIVNFRNDASEVNIKVFNRWGEKLYEENGNDGWDGTYKNEQAPEGVYLYIIEVTCENDRTQLFKGDLTILR